MVKNDMTEWKNKNTYLFFLTQRRKSVYVCPLSPHFPPINLGRQTPCQKSLVCFALGVSVGPITVSHWLLGDLRPGIKQQKEAKHAWMCWPYFSLLSYALDPAQLSEVWYLINLAFFSFPPSICLTHLSSVFSRSHSFSASLDLKSRTNGKALLSHPNLFN